MRLALIIALSVRAFACQVIEGEHILGTDLAAASPTFAAVDPNLEIGSTPVAGVRRILHAEELLKIARQNGIAAPELPGEVCFERSSRLLTSEELFPVLSSALAMDSARIEILDYSRY